MSDILSNRAWAGLVIMHTIFYSEFLSIDIWNRFHLYRATSKVNGILSPFNQCTIHGMAWHDGAGQRYNLLIHSYSS